MYTHEGETVPPRYHSVLSPVGPKRWAPAGLSRVKQHFNNGVEHPRAFLRCINKSKNASASGESNSFELFRAPKVFEAQPQ